MNSLTAVFAHTICWHLISANILVLDTGSGFLRTGMSYASLPATVEHNVMGRPRDDIPGFADQYGSEAWRVRRTLNLVRPMHAGLVTHWPEQTSVWSYAFNITVPTTVRQPLITSVPADASEPYQEQLEEVFRTHFNMSGIVLVPDALLVMKSQQMTTGLVIQSGYTVTSIVPVVEGQVISGGVRKLNVAGRHLTDHLEEILLRERFVDRDTTNDVKEALCYVAREYNAEMQELAPTIERTYELPDGEVSLSFERFHVPEALFQPCMFGHEGEVGISELAYDAIMACDSTVQQELFENIILAGGTTLLPGMAERIQLDLSIKTEEIVRVHTPLNRESLVWMGGAFMAGTL